MASAETLLATPRPSFSPALGESKAWQWGVLGGLFVLLAGFGAWRLMVRAQPSIEDSDNFKVALDVWDEPIFAQNQSPRAAKRFRNRVRYFAMRERKAEPAPTIWQSIYRAWNSTLPSKWQHEEARSGNEGETPEGLLVALGVLAHINAKWLMEPDEWRKVCEARFSQLKDCPDGMAVIFEKALHQHREQAEDLGAWPPTEEHRKRVLEFAEGAIITS